MKLFITLSLLLITTAGQAQQQCLTRDELRSRIDNMLLEANSIEEMSNNTPLKSPTAKSASVPTSSGNLSSIFDGAQIPTFLAAALNTGLSDSEDGSVSVSANAIMLKSFLVDDDVLSKQSEYRKPENRIWRRFATTLAFGGTGLPLDTDGDGMPNDPAMASDITDQINMEVSYRLAGKSRDRRDDENFAMIASAVRQDVRNIAQIEGQIDRLFIDAVGSPQCPLDFLASKVDTVLAGDEIKSLIQDLSEKGSAFGKNYDDAIKKIDGQLLWTAVLGYVDRDDLLGPDSWRVGIRGAFTAPSQKQFSFSADYTEFDDDPLFLGDLKSLKVAGEMKWFVKNNDPVSVALSYEAFDGSDLREDDELFKVGITYTVRWTQGFTMPISVTYANRTALLQDEDEVIGRLGISFDTDNFLETILGQNLFAKK